MSESKKVRSNKNFNIGDLVLYKKSPWEIMDIQDSSYTIQNDEGDNEIAKISQLKSYNGDNEYVMVDINDIVMITNDDNKYKVIRKHNSFQVDLENIISHEIIPHVRIRRLNKIDEVIEQESKDIPIYIEQLLTRKISIQITRINNQLLEQITSIISKQIEGKCIQNGYIKPKSINIQTYSSGVIKGSYVIFDVVFTCLIANPVEGQQLQCVVENITKAGLKCRLDDDESPFVIFIARDHHYMNENMNKSIGDKVTVKVIGQRFELNDTFISIIAALV